MQSARASALSTRSALTNPGTSSTSSSPCWERSRRTSLALGAVAEQLAAQLGNALARQGERGHQRRHALLGDVAAGEHHQRLGRGGLARLERSRVLALEHGELAVHGRGAQAPGVELREAEGALGNAQAERLNGLADAAAHGPEVLAPVVAAPDLVPVHHEPEAAQRAHERRRQQREVRKRRGVDHVVAAAVAEEVPEHAGAEHERRQHPPAPAGRVELHARAGAHHAHARHLGTLVASPLPKGEVGDLVSIGGQAFAEVPVPPLGTADGVRKEAVVDQTDAHGSGRGSQTLR